MISFIHNIDIESLTLDFDPNVFFKVVNIETIENLQIPFEAMAKTLQSINFFNINDVEIVYTINDLSSSISLCANLRCISITIGPDQFWEMSAVERDLLSSILHGCSAFSPPLELAKIYLEGAIPCIQRSPDVVRHLRHLTQVILDFQVHLSQDETSEDLMNEFWDTLRRERIYLEIIETTAPVISLVNYLESFSGLKKLKFLIGCWDELNPTAGHRLLTHALPCHSASLQYLYMAETWSEPNWVLSVNTAPALSVCKNLRNIGICVEGLKIADGSTLLLGDLVGYFSSIFQ